MPNPTNAAPAKLDLTGIADIHLNHPPTAQALKQIVDYINANVTPVQGNKKAPRK